MTFDVVTTSVGEFEPALAYDFSKIVMLRQYQRSTVVGYLRTRLQAAQGQLKREKDPGRKAELQTLVGRSESETAIR